MFDTIIKSKGLSVGGWGGWCWLGRFLTLNCVRFFKTQVRYLGIDGKHGKLKIKIKRHDDFKKLEM